MLTGKEVNNLMGTNFPKIFERYIKGILPSVSPYSFEDKDRAISQKIAYMLNRTQSMFRWSGLPDSVPQRVLELYLQVNGNVCWYEHEGTLHVFTGSLGGTPDVYYMPTVCVISNPALQLSKTLKIGEECVVMPNDSLYIGMLPMFTQYATSMAETDLSLDIAAVNSRIVDLVSAPDDRTKNAAEEFFRQIRAGRPGVIAENAFLDGIKAQPYGTTGHSTITDLIELLQYQKASWYNELGLNANYNMKRESLNSAESQLNDDVLLPLVDDMLRMRKLYAEKVNEMYGTEISVELASAWEDNQEELDMAQNAINDAPAADVPEDPGEPEPSADVPEDAGEPEPAEDDTLIYQIRKIAAETVSELIGSEIKVEIEPAEDPEPEEDPELEDPEPEEEAEPDPGDDDEEKAD